MWTSSRHMFCTLSAFMSLAVIFYTYRVQIRQESRSRVLPVATDTITPLDNRTFIISPYYEPRLGQSVRVIAILHVSVQELYCIFHCSSNENVFLRAQIDLHSDGFGFPYGTADLLCAEPSGCDYTYMSFSSTNSTNTSQDLLFEVRNRPPQPISANFTVCLSTLYGNYNNVLQVIQSIEMYKILGASRVTIYNTNCSRDVEKVLRHYVDEGTLEVVPWPIDRHLRTSKKWHYSEGLAAEIGYFGQTATLNDCLYRNMYKSRFVLLNDIDEILLPVKDWDWPSLMEDLQNKHPDTSVFRFQSHVFPTSVNNSGFGTWSHVPGVNVLTHLLRRPNNNFTAPKMILNPRDVFQTSIHNTLKHTRNSTVLGQDTTMLFHCKQMRNVDVNDLLPDDRIMRYNLSLVPNVDKVIQRLFPQQ
ncbi:beta-1,4-galactosyltransferase galt-1-like [Rana temporaria]|uniref:beta-1,4-galactosyltransferase galt-1-like n=1 Tax=Rana temporaria TaxID=8407 RepID=UPI001AADA3AB|nr:beta-1,4-galactosyltransferase galt-1-like [Rana temporaria]